MVQLPFSISASQRIFLPNTDFNVTLEHHTDEFRIMTATPAKNYKIVYEKAELLVTKCWLKDTIVKKLFEKFYSIGYCLYPCKRLVPVGPFYLAANQTQFHVEVTRGQKPAMVFAMWSDTLAAMGNYTKNFANYKPLQVKYAVARYGSQQQPEQGFQLNYGGTTLLNPDILELFAAFTIGINGSLATNCGMLDYDRFLYSQNIFCFNFCENQFSGSTFTSNTNEGESLLLDFQFSEGPATSHSLVVIIVTENLITYYSNKQISMDYLAGIVN